VLITDDWRWLISSLNGNSNSFVVYYSRDNYPWIFVENSKSLFGQLILKEVGENLRKQNVLMPVINDEEYKIQFAIGTADCRIYKLNSNIDVDKLLKSRVEVNDF